MAERVTVPSVRAAKGVSRIKMITAYDAPSARIADEAGADVILVGDSVANVVLGLRSTLEVTLDDMIRHAGAVASTQPRALVVGDMPWLSFHVSPAETVRNAGRFVQEGGVEAVKIEGGAKRVPVIEAVLAAEIPVMGHLGLTPQSVHTMGGYRVQGRQVETAKGLIEDALAIEAAGVFCIVLEGVPGMVADLITRRVSVPTVGIGAGIKTDGQVLVFHDVLGLSGDDLPRFVRTYASLHDDAVKALKAFFGDIENGSFPSPEETYEMPADAGRALLEEMGSSGV
jgi:3-methyl-2-oxobutanoate hydroxymethyltransferase